MLTAITTAESAIEVQTTTTLVIRVPRGTNKGLTNAAKTKLERIPNVSTATIIQRRNIDPQGNAIYLTADVKITLEFDSAPDDITDTVHKTLCDSITVDTIEALSTPTPTDTVCLHPSV